jgi:putative two-component system response regulator
MNKEERRYIVLIVDDAPENIHILMETLKDDYAVIAATNGEEALRLAVSAPVPDIILLDVLMPGMDGYEVCRTLKSDAKTENIPVIFVTSMSEESDERRGLDIGAVDYISKPFSTALVKARLRNHLELKQHRDDLEELVQKRTRELMATQDATIFGLATLAEYRDPETGGHIKRTQHYMLAMANHLKEHPRFRRFLDEDSIRLLYKSAPLHDIGKVAVPDNILLKRGELTDAEFRIMKKHTLYGRETITKIEMELQEDVNSSFLRFAKVIAYTHHERWDGTGYYGLKGEEIPVPGRLMVLADIYDALISRRVYKPPIPHQRAVEIIKNGDGRTMPGHFDPDVLGAFIELQETFRRIAFEFADHDEERTALGPA